MKFLRDTIEGVKIAHYRFEINTGAVALTNGEKFFFYVVFLAFLYVIIQYTLSFGSQFIDFIFL